MFNDIDVDEPRYLYKYAPLNNFSLQAIANGHFWYSKLGAFNDPFEPKSPLVELKTSGTMDQLIQANIIDIDDVELANITNEYIYDRFHHDYNSTLQARLSEPSKYKSDINDTIIKVYDEVDDYGVLCLSSIPNDILMWSHYSSNHTGICIQLEIENDSILDDTDKTFRVDYSEEYPTYEFFQGLKNDLSKRQIIQAIVANKSTHWSYENEWRVIEQRGNNVYASPGKISGVIFGLRTTFSQKASIAKLLFGSAVEVYEARRRKNEYAVDIVSMGEILT